MRLSACFAIFPEGGVTPINFHESIRNLTEVLIKSKGTTKVVVRMEDASVTLKDENPIEEDEDDDGSDEHSGLIKRSSVMPGSEGK